MQPSDAILRVTLAGTRGMNWGGAAGATGAGVGLRLFVGARVVGAGIGAGVGLRLFVGARVDGVGLASSRVTPGAKHL